MEGWLQGLIGAIPGPLRPAAALIIGAVIRVYQFFLSLARRVVPGWWDIAAAAVWLMAGIRNFTGDTVNMLRWLLTVRIPQWANHAIDTVRKWATARIGEVRDLARGLVDTLRRWAIDRIRDVLSIMDGLRRWISERVAEIRGAVNRLLDRVFNLWATPARLVAWLIGEIWRAWWRYAWSHMDAITESVWRARRALALRAVAEIERLIGRVL